MPLRDFRGILKMSLFHCDLFYKTITKWFSKQDSVIHALGMLLDFRKAHLRLATSLVHGSRNPARKTIRYSFIVKWI
jgi:hypothetical protein